MELQHGRTVGVADAFEADVPAVLVVRVGAIGIIAVEEDDVAVVGGVAVVEEDHEGDAVGVDAGLEVHHAGDGVVAVAFGGDETGHIRAVSLAVEVAPAVVAGEADVDATDILAVDEDVFALHDVRGIHRAAPVKVGAIHGAGDAGQLDGADAHIAQAADAGGGVIRPVNGFAIRDVVRPGLLPLRPDNAEDADDGAEEVALSHAGELSQFHSRMCVCVLCRLWNREAVQDDHPPKGMS